MNGPVRIGLALACAAVVVAGVVVDRVGGPGCDAGGTPPPGAVAPATPGADSPAGAVFTAAGLPAGAAWRVDEVDDHRIVGAAVDGDRVVLVQWRLDRPTSTVAAYDRDTGALAWASCGPPLPDGWFPAPARPVLATGDDGPVVVLRDDGTVRDRPRGADLLAYEPRDGRLRWRVELDAGTAHLVASDAGEVVVAVQGRTGAAPDGVLLVLDAVSGAERLRVAYTGADDDVAPVAIPGGFLLPVADADHARRGPNPVTGGPITGYGVRAVDPTTGAELWSSADGRPRPGPTVAGRTLLPDEDSVRAVDPGTGRTVWRVDGTDPWGVLAALGESALVSRPPTGDGFVQDLVLLDAATGAPRWTIPGADVPGRPVAGGEWVLADPERLLVIRRDRVVAVDVGSGATRPAPGVVPVLAVDRTGDTVVVRSDTAVVVLRAAGY